MNRGSLYIHELALKAAAQRLARAASFAELHAGKPLLQKIMKQRDGGPVMVRLDWRGVLRVFDPATGELLAESQAGKPDQLALTFGLCAEKLADHIGGST